MLHFARGRGISASVDVVANNDADDVEHVGLGYAMGYLEAEMDSHSATRAAPMAASGPSSDALAESRCYPWGARQALRLLERPVVDGPSPGTAQRLASRGVSSLHDFRTQSRIGRESR